MRFLLPLLLMVSGLPALAQTSPPPKRATTASPAKRGAAATPAAKRSAATADEATVAPGETVELGRASTDYNGRSSTYKKPPRPLPPTDASHLPGGQGVSAAPGQPVQPPERARDDYEGRPVKQPAKTSRPTTPSRSTH